MPADVVTVAVAMLRRDGGLGLRVRGQRRPRPVFHDCTVGRDPDA